MAGAGLEQVVKTKLPEGDYVSPRGIDNVDWLALREEWVTTGISLPELARKYQLNYFTVRSYYYRHQWAYHLAEFRSQIHDSVRKVRDAKSEELATRLAKVDERVIGLCETVLDTLEQNIDATIEYKDAINGEVNTLDIKDAVATIKQAVDTLHKVHATARLAGGGATGKIDLGILPELTEEEKGRLHDEFNYLRAKPKATITVSHVVVGDKPSQDPQGAEGNV